MDTITHALIPVIAVAPWAMQKDSGWTGKRLTVLGIFGALPDLLHPHIALEARYSSLSHGLPALAIVGIVLFFLFLVKMPGMSLKFALCFLGAYGFHLLGDLLSGGIAWSYPLGYKIVGHYIVPSQYWIPMDILSILVVYVIYRGIPCYLRFRKNRNKSGVQS